MGLRFATACIGAICTIGHIVNRRASKVNPEAIICAAMTSKPRIDVRLRINFGWGGALGPGKIALLEQIASGGSLAWAAAELDMSYRRAWALLKDLERGFDQPVALTTKGGVAGGGARLTPFARRLVAAYRAVEEVAASAAAAEFASVVRSHEQRKRPRRRNVKKERRGRRPAPSRR